MFARLFSDRQQRLKVFLGLEFQAMAPVRRADDRQRLVVYEPRSTELAVENFRLQVSGRYVLL